MALALSEQLLHPLLLLLHFLDSLLGLIKTLCQFLLFILPHLQVDRTTIRFPCRSRHQLLLLQFTCQGVIFHFSTLNRSLRCMILLFDAVIPCRCWYGGWLDCVIDKFIIWIVDDCVPFFSYYIHCLKHIHCVVDASLDVFEIYIIAKLFVQYKNLVGDICPACIWVFSDALEHRSAQKHQFLVFLLAWARAF